MSKNFSVRNRYEGMNTIHWIKNVNIIARTYNGTPNHIVLPWLPANATRAPMVKAIAILMYDLEFLFFNFKTFKTLSTNIVTSNINRP